MQAGFSTSSPAGKAASKKASKFTRPVDARRRAGWAGRGGEGELWRRGLGGSGRVGEVGWGKGGERQRKDATYSALLISSSLSPPTLSFPLPSTYYPPYPNLYPLPSISCPLPLPYPPSPAHSAPLRPPCTGSASHGRAQPDYRYALESWYSKSCC